MARDEILDAVKGRGKRGMPDFSGIFGKNAVED
jgi:hypothetical protein